MIVEEALAVVDAAIVPKRLTTLQELVFCQAWEGKGYTEIAECTGYETAYIKEIGYKLWHCLSKAFGEKVTKTNFQSVLRHQAQQQAQGLTKPFGSTTTPNQATSDRGQDWGEAVNTSVFYGRVPELTTLEQWIVQDRCRLITVLGMGGVGKTTLSVKLAEQVQGEFAFLIGRSLRNAPPIQETLATLIKFLSNQQDTSLPETIDAQVLRLIEYLRTSRCLLVLDNVESILQSG